MYWWTDLDPADELPERGLRARLAARLRALLAAQAERVAWLIAGVLWLVAVAAVLDRHFIGHTVAFFWDLPVYSIAAEMLARGENPYDSALLQRHGVPHYFHFLTPPHAALILAALPTAGLGALIGPLLIALHLAAMAIIPVVLSRRLMGADAQSLLLGTGFFLVAFGVAGVGSLGAANNSTALYAAILLGLERGLRGRWGTFDGAVLVATLFKPFFAAFWIVPLLLDGVTRRALLRYAGLLLGAGAVYVMAIVALPGFSQRWLGNISYQFDVLRIGGVNLFGWVFYLTDGGRMLPTLVHCALLFAMLGCVQRAQSASRDQRLAMLLCVALFANPRMLCYDSAIAAIPIMALASGAMPLALSRPLRLAAAAVAITVVTTALTHHGWLLREDMVFAPVALMALAAAALQRRRQESGGVGALPSIFTRP